MSNSRVTFPFKLTAQVFDPSYDPHPIDNIPEIPSTVYAEVWEGVYYYRAGEADGRMGLQNRNELCPPDFRKNYDSGWSDGTWFYKILNFF